LEETNRSLNKLKDHYEGEVKKSKNLELEKKEMISKIQALEKKEASFDQLSSMLREEISNLSDHNISYKAQISDLERRNESLLEENTSLKNYIDEFDREREDLNQRIQDVIQELNKGDQKISAAVKKVLEEEEEKLNSEISQKIELQNIIAELEPKNKSLEILLEEKKEKIETLGASIEKSERLNHELKVEIQELEDELRACKNDNKELFKRIEKNKHIFGEKISKIWRLCVFKIEGFRNEITSIKSRCTTEFETNQEFVQEIIKDIASYVQDKSNFDRTRAQEEKKREILQLKEENTERMEKASLESMQEKEQIKNHYERLINKISKESEILRNELSETKGELQDALIKMERINQSKIESQKRTTFLEEENEWLKQENSKKEQESQALQKHVREELRRIKEESEQVTRDIIQQANLKTKKEVEGVIKMVDELKYSNITRLKEVAADVLSFEIAHEKDLLSIIEKNQGEKDSLQAELNQLYGELQQKDKEILGLRRDLNKTREMYRALQQESQDMFNRCEEKIEGFKETIKNDNAVYLEKKNQANDEIEHLRTQIKDLNKELRAKNQEIEGLDYRLKLQKDDLTRYRTIIDERSRYERTQADIEKPTQAVDQRGEDLDSLLSKPNRTGSYNKSIFIHNTSDRKTRFTTDDQRIEKVGSQIQHDRFRGSDVGYESLKTKGAR